MREQHTKRGCERRESRAGARSQAGAPLSWTSVRADMLFVCERARKASATERQPQGAERAIYMERAEAFFLCERRRRRRTRDVRAAGLEEELAEQRISVPSAPTKTAAP
jgi:hypothetical protein